MANQESSSASGSNFEVHFFPLGLMPFFLLNLTSWVFFFMHFSFSLTFFHFLDCLNRLC